MKIKVAHILHAVGGVEVSLRLLCSNIDPEKFEFIVIHGSKDDPQPFIDKNGNKIKSYGTSIFREINPYNDLNAFSEIKKIVKLEHPHLVHAHSAKGGILGKLIGSVLKIPVLHTPQAYSYLSAENALKRKLFLQIEKFFSKFNNKILACSASEKKRAVTEIGYKPRKVLLFNNCIEPIEETELLSVAQTWPENYICSVGRPSYQKNIEMMVEVVRELKKEKENIHLVLMGVGYHAPNLKTVENLIASYGLQKNITLLEWTKREDIFYIIKHSQLYVSTARYEGLPYSVIESLALKKTVVATDADGNRDLVENGKNGFLVDNDNVAEFTKNVLRLMNDENLRRQFEEASYQKFNENFNIQRSIHKLESIYSDTANFAV